MLRRWFLYVYEYIDYLLTASKEMRVLSKSMTLWRRHVMCRFGDILYSAQQLREQEEHKSISNSSREE